MLKFICVLTSAILLCGCGDPADAPEDVSESEAALLSLSGRWQGTAQWAGPGTCAQCTEVVDLVVACDGVHATGTFDFPALDITCYGTMERQTEGRATTFIESGGECYDGDGNLIEGSENTAVILGPAAIGGGLVYREQSLSSDQALLGSVKRVSQHICF